MFNVQYRRTAKTLFIVVYIVRIIIHKKAHSQFTNNVQKHGWHEHGARIGYSTCNFGSFH